MSETPEYRYSEAPAIQLFMTLGYEHLNGSISDERESINEVILTQRLREAIQRLNPWMTPDSVTKAYQHLTSITGSSLMEINQKVWTLIRGGSWTIKQVINGREDFHPVSYLDFINPENNEFLIVNQMKYKGKAQNSIPDLVVYVNGLPLAVIECKSPNTSSAWDKAYSDLKYYQENSEPLFYYNQICCGIWGTHGKYGAIQAPAPFYSLFKASPEDDLTLLGENPTAQDILLYSLFRKERLLDLVRHFVIFEVNEGKTIKKLPRYQQLRATNKTIEKLKRGEGGVVWHTQGSGKSITMAYVARKLQAEEYGFENPTIVVMTDRKDLDRQITTTLRNVGFYHVAQAQTVAHLHGILSNDYGKIITTTLQKFQESDRDKADHEDITEQAERAEEQEGHREGETRVEKLIEGQALIRVTKVFDEGRWVESSRQETTLEELSGKQNLYVLVDEAHRSQYGFLAAFMRTVLPHAKFVAFTGTPISKADKSTLGEFYGGDYIDVYTIKQAVEDGATVPLLYDQGIPDLLVNKQALDADFDREFQAESEEKQDALNRSAVRMYMDAPERIEQICGHIIKHYLEKIHPDGHKALIVTRGRNAAIRYQKAITKLREQGKHNLTTRVVVSLGSAKSDKIAKEYYEAATHNRENPNDLRPIWVTPPDEVKAVSDDFKLPFGDEAETEKSGQKKHDQTAILIVSDMLLTGYDAPIASCLYLDKPLKEHNLLQALARVNRSREGKSAGYIVDYYGIANDLIDAMRIFSGDLERDDLLKNLNTELPHLEAHHNKLLQHFRAIRVDRVTEREEYLDQAIIALEEVNDRDMFKTLFKAFKRSLSIVLPDPRASIYQSDFLLYSELKRRLANAYPEDEDLKTTQEESQKLQQMIDAHISAKPVTSLLDNPIQILDQETFQAQFSGSTKTQELVMRNQLTYTIRVGMDKNPDFYKKLSERLEALIKEREEDRISEAELLSGYSGLFDEINQQKEEGEAQGFDTEWKRAIRYSMTDIFGADADEAAHTIFELVSGEMSIVAWVEKPRVLKDMENKIMRFLKTKLERAEAKAKAKELLNVIKKSNDD